MKDSPFSFEVRTTPDQDGRIVQEIFPPGEDVRQAIFRQVLDIGEKQVRQALIALGWTPPPDKAPGPADHLCKGSQYERGPMGGYGEAADVCLAGDDGVFSVENDESLSSQVNYCPFCGEKAPVQMARKPEPDDVAPDFPGEKA